LKKSAILFFLILFADFFFKRWTLTHVLPVGSLPLIQNFHGLGFSLHFVANQGMAWGFFSSYKTLLLIFRLLLIGALIFYFFTRASKNSLVPLALILAGAVGNVLDTFLYGYVIDMLYPTLFGIAPFAVFNLADAAISTGVVWLVLLMFFERKGSAKAAHLHS